MRSPSSTMLLARADLVAALVRFPVAVAAAAIGTSLVLLRTGTVIPANDAFHQALYGLSAAFLAGAAFSLALDGRGRRAAAGGQIAAVAAGLGVGSFAHELWLSYPHVMVALTAFLMAAPGLALGATPIRFWTHNIRSGFAALIGLAGMGVAVLGVFAILWTLGSLFDLRIPDTVHAQVMVVGLGLLLPLYWLAFQPRPGGMEAGEPKPDILLRTVAALVDFAFVPLLLAYAVILHAYGARIAVEGALPRNQVGWFVSVFLALGYLVFLLSFSSSSPLPRLRRLFRLAWPRLTLAPVVLLALALRARVVAYGVTEERVLVGVVALAAALLFAAWCVQRRLDPRLVPLTFGTLALLVAVGPLSAKRLTVQSQSARFVAILEGSGALKGSRYDAAWSGPWSAGTESELQSIVTLLDRHRALDRLAPVMGAAVPLTGQNLRERLALLPRPLPARPEQRALVAIGPDVLLDEFQFRGRSPHVTFRAPGLPGFDLRVDGLRLVLTGPGGPFTFDLADQPAPAGRSAGTGPVPVVPADDPRAVLILRDYRIAGTGEARRIGDLTGAILVRDAAR